MLPLVPFAGSVRRQRPFLHRVLRSEFPGFHGTMALCDSLCPSRRTRLPSPDGTLRRACPFAPGGPGRSTAGLGFVSRSPPPATSAGRQAGPPRFPGNPCVPLPCSSTPAGPDTPGRYGVPARPPLCPQRRLPRQIYLSGLHSTALGLAVYASSGVLPHPTQNSLPVAGQALPDGIDYPQSCYERFPCISTFSFPELSWRKDIHVSGRKRGRQLT